MNSKLNTAKEMTGALKCISVNNLLYCFLCDNFLILLCYTL